MAIAYGFAEALADRVTVLAQMAERAEEIDVTKAKAAQERAEQRLAAGGPQTDVRERAAKSLAKAIDAPSGRIEGPDQSRLSLLMRVQWAATTHPGIRRTSNEDATAPDRTWASSSSPTGWAATSPVRSPRRSPSTRSRPSSARPRARTPDSTWPHPIDPALGVDGSRLKSAFHLANRRLADEVAAAGRSPRHGDHRVDGAAQGRPTRRCSPTSATRASTCFATTSSSA